MMNLPTTSYILLGMLSAQERSGYDLKLLLDKQVHHVYWSPAKSQIYGELRRLEQAGLTTMTEVEQTNRPDKRLYRITPAGREALHSGWRIPTWSLTSSRALCCCIYSSATCCHARSSSHSLRGVSRSWLQSCKGMRSANRRCVTVCKPRGRSKPPVSLVDLPVSEEHAPSRAAVDHRGCGAAQTLKGDGSVRRPLAWPMLSQRCTSAAPVCGSKK